MNTHDVLPRLRLPKRYEILERAATEAGLNAMEFVERVEVDAKRIDSLLGRVQDSGCGQFELFLGLSGSGKTTFVATLPKFFTGLEVYPFPSIRPLAELPEFVCETSASASPHRVVVVKDRDNPVKRDLETARQTFDGLRRVFRSNSGAALVLWPITDGEAAGMLASLAWDVGRDSVVGADSRGLHRFTGLSRDRYYPVADITSRNLSGDGLEAFGVTEASARQLLIEEETITGFYSAVETVAEKVRGDTLSILTERVRPQVWVVLPGDVVDAVEGTVSSLTQGTRSRVDVDLLGEFIDNPQTDANYIVDWRARRGRLAHIMRALDVRLFGLPPNVALAAIRAYGDPSTVTSLRQRSTDLGSAKETMRRSRLYKAILQEAGEEPGPYGGIRPVAIETENEYRRVQAKAASSDVTLNRALGKLIEATLSSDRVEAEVVVERQDLPGSRLRPDIQIRLPNGSYICLEPTWRSTDTGIEGEIPKGQNTLSPGHIKKYLLGKVTEYVKDLEL